MREQADINRAARQSWSPFSWIKNKAISVASSVKYMIVGGSEEENGLNKEPDINAKDTK